MYLHCVHIKRCHWFFHNNFYKYARIFMIFVTQLCKCILIILVTLLRCVPCTVHPLPGDVMLTSLKTCRSPCTWHCHHAGERRQILSLQRCGHPIRQIWIRWTTRVSFKRGNFTEVYRSRIHDVKELKERLLMEWRMLDHTIITALTAQWRSRLNACVCVNGGHF